VIGSRRARRCHGEAGTGLIATATGTLVFMVLLLLAVQVSFDLYARSAVDAAAFDAVRVVTGSDAGAAPSSLDAAEQHARQALGRYGRLARFSWQVGATTVGLTVSVRDQRVLPAALLGPLGLDTVSRTVVLRREQVS
jgi:Flp pilus assembly protein TadG